jgi:signal transduction histidine kinase
MPQVFQNLIRNALKYFAPRSPVVIEIRLTEKDGERPSCSEFACGAPEPVPCIRCRNPQSVAVVHLQEKSTARMGRKLSVYSTWIA